MIFHDDVLVPGCLLCEEKKQLRGYRSLDLDPPQRSN